MTRELILLRHAHADVVRGGEADISRRLSTRGIAEATSAGLWLNAHGAAHARILCSPALRTRQTLQQAFGAVEAKFEPRIYEATAGELVALIDEHADAPRLMLVGHNPGLETLVALLTTGQTGDFRGMPPASVAWIDLDGPLEPGAGRLKNFWAP